MTKYRHIESEINIFQLIAMKSFHLKHQGINEYFVMLNNNKPQWSELNTVGTCRNLFVSGLFSELPRIPKNMSYYSNIYYGFHFYTLV